MRDRLGDKWKTVKTLAGAGGAVGVARSAHHAAGFRQPSGGVGVAFDGRKRRGRRNGLGAGIDAQRPPFRQIDPRALGIIPLT